MPRECVGGSSGLKSSVQLYPTVGDDVSWWSKRRTIDSLRAKLSRDDQTKFYKIDKMLFSPAEVTINNLLTGRVIRRGHVNPDVLQASLGLA